MSWLGPLWKRRCRRPPPKVLQPPARPREPESAWPDPALHADLRGACMTIVEVQMRNGLAGLQAGFAEGHIMLHFEARDEARDSYVEAFEITVCIIMDDPTRCRVRLIGTQDGMATLTSKGPLPVAADIARRPFRGLGLDALFVPGPHTTALDAFDAQFDISPQLRGAIADQLAAVCTPCVPTRIEYEGLRAILAQDRERTRRIWTGSCWACCSGGGGRPDNR